MKIPEGIFVLITSTLSGFSSPLRFITQEGEVKISKSHFTCFHVRCFDLTTRVSGEPPAEWSLIVAKFDERYCSVGVTLKMGRMADNAIH